MELYDIATATTRKARAWHNERWSWHDFARRCAKPVRTHETFEQYMAMDREQQSALKDVGGFVGGFLDNGQRRNGAVRHRSLLTLDVDNARCDFWDLVTRHYRTAALIYSTHKHTMLNPRYRLVMPLSRNVDPVEYEAIGRRVAATLGMEQFDTSTYEAARLMYWPSASADGAWDYHHQPGGPLEVDEVLATYTDWHDCSSWPVAESEQTKVRREMALCGDPRTKPGVIGAFCRAYPIEDAIATFLGGVYTPAGRGRYTYAAGHVAGGLVCYDGLYAYGHNDTDPAGRQCCNAFDLCRIHLYGDLDGGSRAEDITRRPSYGRMIDFAMEQLPVKRELIAARQAQAEADFADLPAAAATDPMETTPRPPAPAPDAWMDRLDMDRKGKVRSTAPNVELILENDPRLARRFACNDFTGFTDVLAPLPWRKGTGQWTDTDSAGLRTYLARSYDIAGRDIIKDSFLLVGRAHAYHPIRDYLEGLHWDGHERLDRLLITCLGAPDDELTRATTRKQFTAAVARIFNPGCKHDYCLVLTGAEGIGKSTLLRIMGGAWFNDSVSSLSGKEGMEQLRRAWLIELGELSGLKRSDTETVKAFISRQVDTYRRAYGEMAEEYPRQCVFFGTTNEDLFLKTTNGNRRFWVVETQPTARPVSQWAPLLEAERDQLWAEAVARYRQGEKLYLPESLEAKMRAKQARFNADAQAEDELGRDLAAFLDLLLPVDWDDYNLNDRRNYWRTYNADAPGERRARSYFCVPEFLCERLGMDRFATDYRYMSLRVAKAMRDNPDWECIGARRFAGKLYGQQQTYAKITADADDEL